MPIIVDEVVISVEVANRPPGAAGSGVQEGGAEQRRGIIAECVERVLDILSQKEER